MPKETTLNPNPPSTGDPAVPSGNMDSQDLARMIRDRRLAQAPSAPAIEPKPKTSELPPVKMSGTPPNPEPEPEDPLETATESESDPPPNEPDPAEPTATDAEMEEMIGSLPADQSKAIRAMYERINKVTKNWRQEQQQREALEARIKELTGTKPAEGDPKPEPQPAAPIPNIPEGTDPVLADIDAKITQVNKVLAWVRANPDGGTINPGPGKSPIELDADQVAQLNQETWSEITALKSRRAVREDTVRERLNQDRTRAYQAAVKTYPWLQDQNHPLFKQAVAYVNANPGLKSLPNFHQVVGDIISGQTARAKKPAPKPATQREAEPTPVVAGGSGGGPTQTDAESELQAAEDRFAKEGTPKAQQALIRARRRYRAAA